MKKSEIELNDDGCFVSGRVSFDEGDDYFIGVSLYGRTEDMEKLLGGEHTKLHVYAACWDDEINEPVDVYDYDEVISVKDINDYYMQLLIDKINFRIQDANTACTEYLKSHKEGH